MKHTVKYWDKKLLSLQRLADSVGYDIDSDPDYLNVCQLLTTLRSKPAPVEIFPLFYRAAKKALCNMHNRHVLALCNLHKF